MTPELRIIRFELDRLFEHFEGLIEAFRFLKDDPEVREIFGLGILLNGSPEPLDRRILLPRLNRQGTPQMQRGPMIGVRGERLAAADLRVEISAGLQMDEAGLIERLWCLVLRWERIQMGPFIGSAVQASLLRHGQ